MQSNYNLIFFGADQYSAIVLEALINVGIATIASVITDQGKPKDRSQLVGPNPVDKLAKEHNLKILYYPSNQDEMNSFIDSTKSISADLGIIASFGHILPPNLINIFSDGIINIHPSLLPQYRGATPVPYALALGDEMTGVSIFPITADVDNGNILFQSNEPILPTDTTPILLARLFARGSKLIIQYLQGSVPCKPSTNYKVRNLVMTHRLTRDSGYVEWPVFQKLRQLEIPSSSETTNELLRIRLTNNPSGPIMSDLFRALYPWPGIWTIAQTKKGDLRLSLESVKPEITVKLAGKPRSISYNVFAANYL